MSGYTTFMQGLQESTYALNSTIAFPRSKRVPKFLRMIKRLGKISGCFVIPETTLLEDYLVTEEKPKRRLLSNESPDVTCRLESGMVYDVRPQALKRNETMATTTATTTASAKVNGIESDSGISFYSTDLGDNSSFKTKGSSGRGTMRRSGSPREYAEAVQTSSGYKILCYL